MNALPANVDLQSARLPATYENARKALETCQNVDECKHWADQAEALASYAKMANDDDLMKMSARVKARAIRRCGELLRRFDGRSGTGGNRHSRKGDLEKRGVLPFSLDPKPRKDPKPTRAEIGKAAGLSADQIKDATRIANVPEKTFEAAVEADKPATVTDLADMGRKYKTMKEIVADYDPADFQAATAVGGALSHFVKRIPELSLSRAVRGCDAKEREEWLIDIETIQRWLVKAQTIINEVSDVQS